MGGRRKLWLLGLAVLFLWRLTPAGAMEKGESPVAYGFIDKTGNGAIPATFLPMGLKASHQALGI